jgi:signal transduction histidine kinase
MFVLLKDSIGEIENRQLTEEAQAKYELEKKETQIKLLQNDQRLKALALDRQRTFQIGVAIAFVLSIVIAVLAVGWLRAKNKAKRALEIEQLRNTIARDLHDDIGSTLSTINIASNLAIKGNNQDNRLYLNQIAGQSSKMMERMTDIVWSINPINDPLEKLLAKIKEFSSEILEPKDITIHFYGEESLRNLSIDVESRKNLFLISKEALNNIAKYSEATMVEITLKRVASNLILIINDNGKGFVSESVLPGNGLRNMKVRAQALRAELTLTSAENQGTRIEVIFPIT